MVGLSLGRDVGVSLTLREAATTLHISMNTARRWIKSGKLNAKLRDGIYGSEYIIEESELIRIQEESIQRATLIQTAPSIPNIEVPATWLLTELQERITNAIRDQVEIELASVREENAQLKNYIENRLEKRDQNLVEAMHTIFEARSEQTKPWWKRILK